MGQFIALSMEIGHCRKRPIDVQGWTDCQWLIHGYSWGIFCIHR